MPEPSAVIPKLKSHPHRINQGICVYDWDRCKATPPSAPATPAAPVKDFKAEAKARIAKKAVEMAAPIPPGPTPKPKLNCTMIDEAS
jgi:hypothetical protein